MSQCSPGTHARPRALSRQRVLDTPALLDWDVLAATDVAAGLAAAHITWRQRPLPPPVTLWALLWQVLRADGSCRAAVTRVRAMRGARGQEPPSPNTGSDCTARLRLPEAVGARLAQVSGPRPRHQGPASWRWKGRRVKVVDGTTVSMPETLAHQTASPQPPQPPPGLGLPIARALGVLCLASGMLVNLASGRYQGTETGEPALLRQVAPTLAPGAVVLGERCVSASCMLAELSMGGVAYVGRQPQRRKTDLHPGQRLGREDRLVGWQKPGCPAWLEAASSAQRPEQLHVRELRVRVPC